ncbi:MAG: PQQ-binding-like beta-propeller repeat protein [Deltaproteobacteria bacterium]|nr:PQQ-binding-like beta-propeller repeat protein [Deltaproteobacteria bacterium]
MSESARGQVVIAAFVGLLVWWLVVVPGVAWVVSDGACDDVVPVEVIERSGLRVHAPPGESLGTCYTLLDVARVSPFFAAGARGRDVYLHTALATRVAGAREMLAGDVPDILTPDERAAWERAVALEDARLGGQIERYPAIIWGATALPDGWLLVRSFFATGKFLEALDARGERRWVAPLPDGHPDLSRPFTPVAGALVTVARGADGQHSLVALDATTGAHRWTAPLPASDIRYSVYLPPVATGSLVVALLSSRRPPDLLVAWDATAGEERWRQTSPIGLASRLSADDGVVVLAGSEGVVALDHERGELLGKLTVPDGGGCGATRTLAACVEGDHVVFQDLFEPTRRWQIPFAEVAAIGASPGAVQLEVASEGDRVIVAATANQQFLEAYQLTSIKGGRVEWRVAVPPPVSTVGRMNLLPAPGEGALPRFAVLPTLRGVVTVDTAEGKALRHLTFPDDLLTTRFFWSRGLAVAQTDDGDILTIDGTTGEVATSVKLPRLRFYWSLLLRPDQVARAAAILFTDDRIGAPRAPFGVLDLRGGGWIVAQDDPPEPEAWTPGVEAVPAR